MTDDYITQSEYSEAVALAQKSTTLDNLAAELQRLLFAGPLPEPITNAGLTIEGEAENGLQVKANGVILRGRVDHVWIKGDSFTWLAGRIRFFRKKNNGEDGDVLYQIIFDDIGNARLGDGNHFSESILPGESFKGTHRRIALGLLKSIHDSLDVIHYKP